MFGPAQAVIDVLEVGTDQIYMILSAVFILGFTAGLAVAFVYILRRM